MRAYATASGGVMFVPDEMERTIPKVRVRSSNDNADELLDMAEREMNKD